MLASLLALSSVLIGCPTGSDDGGGSINFNGEYWEDGYSASLGTNSCKATLDLNAKTLTVTQEGTASSYTPFTLNDVTISETTDVSWGSSMRHDVTWAYVYNGSNKVGYVYRWTMTTSNGYIAEISYGLHIGSQNIGGSGPTYYAAQGNPNLDLTDVVTTNKFSGDKEE
ncbi:MAG: hypothetical protein LBB77_08285 [Treponema sp.]|jgi:hypothetical protein|nr:hypothetical protein [Treponema sp.]